MKIPVFLIISSFFVISCIKDKKTTWDTEILAPIVKSKLTVSDILKSEYIITNSDSSLKLVYASDLFSMNTDSFVELPDSTFEVGASLQSLELPSDTIEYRITMGEISRSIDGFLGAFENAFPILKDQEIPALMFLNMKPVIKRTPMLSAFISYLHKYNSYFNAYMKKNNSKAVKIFKCPNMISKN